MIATSCGILSPQKWHASATWLAVSSFAAKSPHGFGSSLSHFARRVWKLSRSAAVQLSVKAEKGFPSVRTHSSNARCRPLLHGVGSFHPT